MPKNKKVKTKKAPTTRTKRRNGGPYPFEAFVKNWTRASSLAEVVKATKLTRNTVSAIATRLRKSGVKLKQMPRRTARVIDTSTLNKIIASA